jgi:hypothetical protein
MLARAVQRLDRAYLEDARDALIDTDHLAEAAQIEHQIQVLSLRLGFDEPGGSRG